MRREALRTCARGALDLRYACSFAAGGMLAPVLEVDVATPAVSRAGERALGEWERIAAALGRPGPRPPQRQPRARAPFCRCLSPRPRLAVEVCARV